jgi:hypothetical protein
MIKPIEAEPITEFLKINETQCLCYKMPYEDGWVIQGLGKIGTTAPVYQDIDLSENGEIAQINEPNLVFPIVLCVGLSLISNWLTDN